MKPQSVLLVEDEGIIRMMLKSQLKRGGIPIILETGSGEEAVEIALRERPQLVCMDIRLRGAMDGIEAAQRISARESIPIIFVSAYDNREFAGRLSNVNVAAILDKPVTMEELWAAIAAIAPR